MTIMAINFVSAYLVNNTNCALWTNNDS